MTRTATDIGIASLPSLNRRVNTPSGVCDPSHPASRLVSMNERISPFRGGDGEGKGEDVAAGEGSDEEYGEELEVEFE